MTRYYSHVSNDVLPELRSELMPAGLRLVAEVRPGDYPHTTLVEVEDDDAPADLAGCTVSPTISAEYRNGKVIRTWVSERTVEARPEAGRG